MRNSNEMQKKNLIIYTLAGIALGLLALNIIQYNWMQGVVYEKHENAQAIEMGDKWSEMEQAYITCSRFVEENPDFNPCQLETHDDEDGFWVEVIASPKGEE